MLFDYKAHLTVYVWENFWKLFECSKDTSPSSKRCCTLPDEVRVKML